MPHKGSGMSRLANHSCWYRDGCFHTEHTPPVCGPLHADQKLLDLRLLSRLYVFAGYDGAPERSHSAVKDAGLLHSLAVAQSSAAAGDRRVTRQALYCLLKAICFIASVGSLPHRQFLRPIRVDTEIAFSCGVLRLISFPY